MNITQRLRAASQDMPSIYTNNAKDQKRVDYAEKVIDDAADEIERLTQRLTALERYSNGYIEAQVECALRDPEAYDL